MVQEGSARVLASAPRGGSKTVADVKTRTEALVRAIRAGDPHAETVLVRLLETPLLSVARRMVRDPRTAEDVFIQAMTRSLRHVHDVDDPATFFIYARRAVCNVALDVMRSKHERDSKRALRDTMAMDAGSSGAVAPVVERLAHDSPSAEDQLIADERKGVVRREVDRLGEPGRTLVRLYYERGLNLDQIAEATGMSRRSAIRKVGAARVLLAVRLRELEGALDGD